LATAIMADVEGGNPLYSVVDLISYTTLLAKFLPFEMRVVVALRMLGAASELGAKLH
jgi:hypothetical protein